MMRYLTLILFSVVLIAACASKEERLQNRIQLVNEFKALDDFDKNNILFYELEHTRSKFTYYSKDGEINIINEELYTDNNTNSNCIYYYDDNKPIYTKIMRIRIDKKDNQLFRNDIEIEIYFDHNYEALYSFKVENKTEKEIDPEELKSIYEHAKKLYSLAKADL
ncbi:MAG TPA: hypothetical protein VK870_15555 [Ignavibacteriaceae bacterium]|nr:hypothetical protein [Ignavibacteriaceae bacterium]